MFGKIEIFPAAVSLISLTAALTDILRGRIYNWLTLPAFAAGLIFSAVTNGWGGLGDGLLASLVGLLLYGWMFWLGAMGGGDVKLLMAFGAWGGTRFVFDVGLLGILIGGAMALGILLFKGRLVSLGKRLYRFFLTLIVKELEPEFPQVDHKLTMPFGIPIAAAAVWVVFDNPLLKWGIHP